MTDQGSLSQERVLWLAKGLPRFWLAEGEHLSAQQLPTDYGRISLTITSLIDSKRQISTNITAPPAWTSTGSSSRRGAPPGGLVLRLRAPTTYRMASATFADGSAIPTVALDGQREAIRFSHTQLGEPGMLSKLTGITVKYTKAA